MGQAAHNRWAQASSIADLQALLQVPQPAIVLVGAAWCLPARLQKQVLEQADLPARLVYVDADAADAAARWLRCSTVPTLIIFARGQEAWRSEGFAMPELVRARLEQAVATANRAS